MEIPRLGGKIGWGCEGVKVWVWWGSPTWPPTVQSPQFALVKTCQKCLDLPAKASYLVFKSHSMRSKPINYDALLKEFISDFFPDFIAFANPALHAAIDWEKGYVFLEQELINALRGKFKIKGKSKRTDRLVKVVLKLGADLYVYVHAEFPLSIQHMHPFTFRSSRRQNFCYKGITIQNL